MRNMRLAVRLLPFGRTGGRRAAVAGLVLLLLPSLCPLAFAEDAEPVNGVDAEVAVTQGIIAFQLGDYEEALRRFEPLPKEHPVAAEYRELCHARLNIASPVRPASHSVSAGSGQAAFPAAGCTSDGRCGVCGGGCTDGCVSTCLPEPRRWNLTFFTGYQYDSNVTLTPEFSGLGSDQGIDDSAWLAALFGDYRVVQQETVNVGVIGSVFSNFYFNDGRDFNVQDYMGGAYTNVAVSEALLLGVRYEYHDTFVDNESFAGESRFVPNITFRRPGVGHVTWFYEFDNVAFDAGPLIPAMDLNGDTHAFGVTQALYTYGGEGRIFAGYRYEERFTDGTDFDRETHQVNARIEQPLTERVIADVGVRYFWDDYLNSNSLDFLDRARDDTRFELRTGLQIVAGEHVSYRLDYTFIGQDSNVENLFGVKFYDYDRHLFAAQFIYDF